VGNIDELYNLLTVLVDEEQRAKLEKMLSDRISFVSNKPASTGTCISYMLKPALNSEEKEKIEDSIYEMGIKKWEFGGN